MQTVESIPIKKIILYFVPLLKYQHQHYDQDNLVKLFYPVPVHSVKRLSMEIDLVILYHMLNELGNDDLCYNNIKGRILHTAKMLHTSTFLRSTLISKVLSQSYQVESASILADESPPMVSRCCFCITSILKLMWAHIIKENSVSVIY